MRVFVSVCGPALCCQWSLAGLLACDSRTPIPEESPPKKKQASARQTRPREEKRIRSGKSIASLLASVPKPPPAATLRDLGDGPHIHSLSTTKFPIRLLSCLIGDGRPCFRGLQSDGVVGKSGTCFRPPNSPRLKGSFLGLSFSVADGPTLSRCRRHGNQCIACIAPQTRINFNFGGDFILGVWGILHWLRAHSGQATPICRAAKCCPNHIGREAKRGQGPKSIHEGWVVLSAQIIQSA